MKTAGDALALNLVGKFADSLRPSDQRSWWLVSGASKILASMRKLKTYPLLGSSDLMALCITSAQLNPGCQSFAGFQPAKVDQRLDEA